jgi:hypothetical protein
VNYHRKLNRNISSTAALLYSLLKKDAKFVWGPEQQQALDAIKDALTSKTVLAWLREKDQANCPYLVETDASIYGSSAVLKQAIFPKGPEKVIAYSARSLTRHEKGLSQMMLQTIALVFAFQSFERILGNASHPFEVRSDNLSLTYLNSLKMSRNAKLARVGRIGHFCSQLEGTCQSPLTGFGPSTLAWAESASTNGNA